MTAALVVLVNAGSVSAFKTTGYTTRHSEITVSGGGSVSNTVSCGKGKVVVSGGVYWHKPGANPDITDSGAVTLSASLPVNSGHAWYAAGHAGQTMVMAVTVHCLPTSTVGTYTIKTLSVADVPGYHTSTAGGTVHCGSGKRVVTGGAGWLRPGHPFRQDTANHRVLQSLSPTLSADGWFAAGYGLIETHSYSLKIVALCRPANSVGAYQGTAISSPSGGYAGSYWACPPGTWIVAGGAYWHYPGQDPDWKDTIGWVASLAPTLDRNGIYAAGVGDSAGLLTLVVFCRPH